VHNADVAIECFEKSRRGLPLNPLETLVDFEVIYNGCSGATSSVRAASFASASAALRRLWTKSPTGERSETDTDAMSPGSSVQQTGFASCGLMGSDQQLPGTAEGNAAAAVCAKRKVKAIAVGDESSEKTDDADEKVETGENRCGTGFEHSECECIRASTGIRCPASSRVD
jgi:hypothetical protein